MIITLLTDFGLCDNFVGVVKGVILGINPKVRIVDISHSVMPGDILQAAFLLKYSYLYFPRETIHLVVVDPGVGSEREAIIARTGRYCFIGPDNGVLSLALAAEEKAVSVVRIANQKFFLKPVSSTFHGRDIFAPVAAYLSLGRNITEFGTVKSGFRQVKLPQPESKQKALRGQIIYIDRFGNLITNIQEGAFRRFVKGRGFRIYLKDTVIDKISTAYMKTSKKPLAIFGSFGNLEISLSCGSARDYFGAEIGQSLRVLPASKQK